MLSSRAIQQAGPGTEFAQFGRLIEQTPELSAYRRQLWMRHADAPAEGVAEAFALLRAGWPH